MAKYRIKSVSEKTGIAKVTLQAWERRYQVVTPKRNSSGYRLYSDAEVDKLLSIKKLIEQGYTVSEAIALLKSSPSVKRNHEELLTSLLEALISFDSNTALDTLFEFSLDDTDLIHQVYFPLLGKLDKGMSIGLYSIAQEHFTSTFVRDQLVGIFREVNRSTAVGKTVIAACLPQEQHDIGLLSLSIELAIKDHPVIFLGTRVSIEDLLDCCEKQRPNILCLYTTERDEELIYNYISSIRQNLYDGVHIYLGGCSLSQELNIDGVLHFTPLSRTAE